jgi:hypothetical protein
MKKYDQAFPVGYNGHLGMTLRDYFASAAMQGILAGSGEEDGFVRYDADALAEQVYVMADAMLEARKK